MNDVYNYETFKPIRTTKDPISALCLTENYLFITCESGKASKYNLMSLTTITKYNLDDKMIKIGLSPQGQYLWTISEFNILNIWDIEKQIVERKRQEVVENNENGLLRFNKTRLQ